MNLDEKETLIYQNAAARDNWTIFSDDSVMIRKFKKMGLEVVKEQGRGVVFKLPANQLTFRKKRKSTSRDKARISRLNA